MWTSCSQAFSPNVFPTPLRRCSQLPACAAELPVYAAVLARQDKETVERATAIGFFFGLVLGLLGLAIDFLT
jgi:hypothetical protein